MKMLWRSLLWASLPGCGVHLAVESLVEMWLWRCFGEVLNIWRQQGRLPNKIARVNLENSQRGRNSETI